jgi:enediyne biosynthesis protein CalE5
MEGKTVEAGEFRNTQRDQWNTAASGWRKHSEMIDRAAGGVSERLVELAGVKAGDRVLDVAAGYGEPSLTAARAAGPEGSVVASDISAEMLAYGRERAKAAGLESIEFIESDAVSLDFPADSFDAAVSRWGIIFEPDGEGAAERVRGFLKDGARFAIASWGQPQQVPFIAIPMMTACQHLGVDPPPPGTPGPLSRPTPDAIGGLLEGGGFSDVQTEETQVAFSWASPEEFTEWTREIVAPITAMVRQHPEDVQKGTWDAITQAIRKASGGDGEVEFSSVALLALGTA